MDPLPTPGTLRPTENSEDGAPTSLAWTSLDGRTVAGTVREVGGSS